jgi:spore coat protein U-like protein
MRRFLAGLLVLGACPWLALAQQGASATVRVQARVNAVCEVVATQLDFGVYSEESGSPLQGSTLLKATCTPRTSYQIGLGEGTAPGATVQQRRMISASSNVLHYQLYSDPARSRVWGNTPGVNTVTGVGTGLPQAHIVFGSVPAAQSAPIESYGDTIIVRIYY